MPLHVGCRYSQSDSARDRTDAERDAYWRNLVNTTEPSVCGGDAIGLMSNYFDHFLRRTRIQLHTWLTG